MRRLFTTGDAQQHGVTLGALVWGDRTGRWRRVVRGVYAVGQELPSDLDVARARVLATGGPARGALAGVLHELDGIVLGGRPIRRQSVDAEHIVTAGGVPCVDALYALVDLAATVDDLVWEHALESALRKRLTTVADLEGLLPSLGRARASGTARIRRVLARRPPGAPPTESLLETLMVQLARTIDGLPAPVRQYVVVDAHGSFVARVDLSWPELGLFIELDGQQHKHQPVYDARRETAVVAATGWLCGRFTWYEVVHLPVVTARRLRELADQARRRPLVAMGEVGDEAVGGVW